jgi:hypothetical protein
MLKALGGLALVQAPALVQHLAARLVEDVAHLGSVRAPRCSRVTSL